MFETPDDLDHWLAEAGAAPTWTERRGTAADAIALREVIDAVCPVGHTGRPSPPAALAEINRWLEHPTVERTTLEDQDGVATLRAKHTESTDPTAALANIAREAAEALGGSRPLQGPDLRRRRPQRAIPRQLSRSGPAMVPDGSLRHPGKSRPTPPTPRVSE